jgi:ribosomal protein L29
MKGISARSLKNKTLEELNQELRKFKEELQSIRFSKVSGTAVSKLSKIKVSFINRNFFKYK